VLYISTVAGLSPSDIILLCTAVVVWWIVVGAGCEKLARTRGIWYGI